MCVYSMVVDHKIDEWQRRLPPPQPAYVPIVFPPPVSVEEIDEFRRLLERAREYDRRNNEPDCEQDEKRKKLQELAAELGVEIEFV